MRSAQFKNQLTTRYQGNLILGPVYERKFEP